ncbi:MAG TPA: methyltransferase domain-containing protein [Candidatus Polarisedimenticolia bacterium]
MKSAEVASRYSSDALAYLKLWAPVLNPHARRLLAALPLSEASRVIDIGSGVGALLADISGAAPRAFVVAVDGSHGMLRLAPAGHGLAVCDARHLALGTGVFDAAVMAFMLFHVPSPLDALVEAARVLRPGGAIGATTWDGEPSFPALQAWNEELDAHGAAPAEPAIADHEPVSTPAKVGSLLRRAGFASVSAWSSPFEHRFTLEGFIAKGTELGGSRRRVESLTPAAKASFMAGARRRLATMPPADFTDDGQIIFATARRP